LNSVTGGVRGGVVGVVVGMVCVREWLLG